MKQVRSRERVRRADRSEQRANHPQEDSMIERRDALRLVATTILLLGSALAFEAALAQPKVVLKASDVHPAGYPTVVATESMGKKREQATSGRISIQMYPSMQLGGYIWMLMRPLVACS